MCIRDRPKPQLFRLKNKLFEKQNTEMDVPPRYDRPFRRDAVQLTFRPNYKSDNPMIRHGQAEKSLTKILKNGDQSMSPQIGKTL